MYVSNGSHILKYSKDDARVDVVYGKVGIVCLFARLFYLGLRSLSTIFQHYEGVRMWQGAQCSLSECCLTEIIMPQSHYTDTGLTSSDS